MTRKLAVATAVTVLTAVTFVQAQQVAQRAAEAKGVMAKNEESLRRYTWLETTTISVKGDAKLQEMKTCSYAPDGTIKRELLPGPATTAREASNGFKPVGPAVDPAMRTLIDRAVAVLRQYVPANIDKVVAAEKAGNLATQSTASATTLTVKNYLKSGDTFVIALDSPPTGIRTYNVRSYIDKPKEEDLTLVVTYGRLADDTRYPEQAVLEMPAQKIQVKAVSSAYRRAGS